MLFLILVLIGVVILLSLMSGDTENKALEEFCNLECNSRKQKLEQEQDLFLRGYSAIMQLEDTEETITQLEADKEGTAERLKY